jgi:hypothetical protein
LEGHTSGVRSIVFTPDGATLASGGLNDGTVKLWDVASGQPRSTLTGNAGVNRVAFSPDGSLLASAHQDGIIRLWGTDPSGRLPRPEPVATVPPSTMQPAPAPGALPDLRVGQVFLQNGEKSAWILNGGNAPAVGADVQFSVDGEPSDTCRVDVPPGGQVRAVGSKLPPGRHVLRAVVDPDNRIPESNETNNALEAAFTVRVARDRGGATGGRMPIPKGKVATPGLTPDAEGWILLPPLVQRDRDTRDANWKWDGQTAAFSAQKPRAHVSFPATVTGSYELQARVTITKAKDSTAICLPIVGGRAIVLDMKGDRGAAESPTATIRLGGVRPGPQPQANASMNVGTEYTFLCRVAVSQGGVGVEVFRDDQILFRWVGPLSQVAERRMIRPGAVELETAYYSSSKFRDLRLRVLTGQATALFPE